MAKRRRESVSGDDGDDDGDDDDDAETTEYIKGMDGGISTKKSSTERSPAERAPAEPLSCPFRKRNRERFNFRDHVQCTRAFKNLALVKCVRPAPLQVPHQVATIILTTV